MKKIFLIPACISLLIAGACSSKDKAEEKKSEEVTVVKTEVVNEREVNQIGNYTATVDPELINNISSAAPLRIKQILVDEGMRVSAGQKLVVMDDVNSTSYQLQVDNAQAVDQMETQLINAKNALAAAERTLRNANENTVLTSPISGVVTARNYDPGDMTGALPILTVARVNPVKVVINVTESELSRIKRGMPALVSFDTYGEETFNGTVSLISPTVDQATRTFGVEITLANNDGKILPGMFGRVQLNLGKEMRVVVPDVAVVKQQGSGNHYVYTYHKDGTVSYDQVELGQRLGDSYELISGVEPGAEVVISGQTRLANGAKVKVQNK